MKYLILLFTVITVIVAAPFETAEDKQNSLLPLSPERRQAIRQTKWGISNTGAGISHRSTILNNPIHRLDGTASAAKSFDSPGLRPDQLGGRLDYTHKTSGSTAFLSADHTRHYGTDVNAGVKASVYQKKNVDVGVVGSYGRHFGGPSGTGKPDGYVGVEGRLTF